MRATGRSCCGAALASLLVVTSLGACSSDDSTAGQRQAAGTAEAAPAVPLGALRGLPALAGPPESADRARLVRAADKVVDGGTHATDPLEVEDTEGPFVVDSQAAWTLALAGHLTGEDRYLRASAAIVDDWVRTARSTENACPGSGSCHTSLMVSRAAPALVYAVDLLVASGSYDPPARRRFHAWLREVVLPAASDRDNNWGDAGTYLQAVIGVELDDRDVQEQAARRWRERLDLVEADGRIPEELRRGDASLMYSQDALDYKVATADVLDRAGIDLWGERGAQGGTLRVALDLVAAGLADPGSWPGGEGDLRVPDPSGVWALAAARWPTPAYARLAVEAAPDDGIGHSAVIWTQVTHPVER